MRASEPVLAAISDWRRSSMTFMAAARRPGSVRGSAASTRRAKSPRAMCPAVASILVRGRRPRRTTALALSPIRSSTTALTAKAMAMAAVWVCSSPASDWANTRRSPSGSAAARIRQEGPLEPGTV
ncbi:hypothetical protein GCM10020220_096110 [Nonomuraea rubra]